MSRALDITLPDRTAKPRQTGLSNLVDNGYGIHQLQDALNTNHPVIDIVKLGWGSAYITTNLEEKIELFRSFEIRTCLGGMMFELAYWQGKAADYASWLDDLGLDMVEVSNGSLPIPEAEKRKMIELFAGRGFTVLSEVGSKEVDLVAPPEEWVEAVQADLQSGAWKVILEGRADASAGIYKNDGSIQTNILDAVLEGPTSVDNLIFEAPHKRQMSWFIHRIGTNVNLGNVPLGEVLNLETLRLGLRGDTVKHFHMDKT